MMFFIRAAFWLIILVLLLPTDERQRSDVYGTAEAAVKDVSGFCARNPTVCEKGRGAFDIFMQKAEFGAQMLMGFFEEKAGEVLSPEQKEPGASDGETIENAEDKQGLLGQPKATPAHDAPERPAVRKPVSADLAPSKDTLTIEDLIPAWNGPESAGA